MFESNSTRIGGSSSNDLEGQGHKAKCIPEKRSLTKPSTSLSVQSNSIGDPMEVLCMIRLFLCIFYVVWCDSTREMHDGVVVRFAVGRFVIDFVGRVIAKKL